MAEAEGTTGVEGTTGAEGVEGTEGTKNGVRNGQVSLIGPAA